MAPSEDNFEKILNSIDDQDLNGFRKLVNEMPERCEEVLEYVIEDGLVEFARSVIPLIDIASRTDLIDMAVATGNVAMVELLLKSGAKIRVDVNKGCFSLKIAVENGHLEVVRLLVEYGVDLTDSVVGTTALMAAQQFPDIQAYLATKGATSSPANRGIEIHAQKDQVSFQLVRNELKQAIRAAVNFLRASNPSDHFYAFAIYDAEGLTPRPSAATEESYSRITANVPADELWDYKCIPSNWAFENVRAELFRGCDDYLNEIKAEYERLGKSWTLFQMRSYWTSIMALKECYDEEVFQRSGFKDAIILFSLSDDARSCWLEVESARLINKPIRFEEFMYEWHQSRHGAAYAKFQPGEFESSLLRLSETNENGEPS